MSLKLPSTKLTMASISMIFLFSSCQLFFDEIEECINKIVPKLPPKNLVQGQVGVPYFESIQAEMKNADDDAFDYEFSIESGTIPVGVSYGWDGRLLKFSGTPKLAGTYKFKLKVRTPLVLSGPGDGICFGKVYDKQEYEIVILE